VLQFSCYKNQKTNHLYIYNKVAVRIVRRLFLKQSQPYNEVELFQLWQSKLPGVGDTYNISRPMLLGVAICTNIEPNNGTGNNDMINVIEYQTSKPWSGRQWHYLPVDLVSTDPKTCFELLYSYKDIWYMYELEPYIYHLLDALPSTDNIISSSELLLQYTKLITEDRNGMNHTYYMKK
jgi:hypothetical protein